jgi:hypothetical protein
VLTTKRLNTKERERLRIETADRPLPCTGGTVHRSQSRALRVQAGSACPPSVSSLFRPRRNSFPHSAIFRFWVLRLGASLGKPAFVVVGRGNPGRRCQMSLTLSSPPQLLLVLLTLVLTPKKGWCLLGHRFGIGPAPPPDLLCGSAHSTGPHTG